MPDRLHRLYSEHGQSPWLDNLRRDWITDGTLADRIRSGVRGLTSNPSIFQKAIAGSDLYDGSFRSLMAEGRSVEDAYWEMVCDDIAGACDLLGPVHESADGRDGFVSVEVSPSLAHDTEATIEAAQWLHRRVDRPNVMIKIPGTRAGLGAVRAVVGRGINVNVTLLFSTDRYLEVFEAHLAGLEDYAAGGGDVSRVNGVASFFVSRVDTEVDRRLESIGSDDARSLRGTAAVANARAAYWGFGEQVASGRWQAMAAAGAPVPRPLWASTSTKDPAFPDTLYVDTLIGPDTVNTLPDATLDAFVDHGVLARTVDAEETYLDDLVAVASAGVDLDAVCAQLEDEGVAAFQKSFDEVLSALTRKAATF
ncbi:MAG TPA: transaldolase [Acidimicrobiales bacterium]